MQVLSIDINNIESKQYMEIMKNMFNKNICLAIMIVILFLSPFTVTIIAETNNYKLSNPPESHVVPNVPYVSQQTGYYCAYAAATMTIKYCGVNTSLEEILFLNGIGYSVGYKGVNAGSLAFGTALCREFNFLSELFNLTRSYWSMNISEKPQDECWNEYWMRVKQNISRDIPVRTYVNPLYLKSEHSIVKIPDEIINKIVNFIDVDSSHAIVIVGYNESDNTICFNDPILGAFGYPKLGTYCWMDLSVFKQAILSSAQCHLTLGVTRHLFIDTYQKNGEPLSKETIFELCHNRNIQKMMGNSSIYSDDNFVTDIPERFQNLTGINALVKLREEFKLNLITLFSTNIAYKKQFTGINILINLAKFFAKFLTYDGVPDKIIEEQFIATFLLVIMDKEFNLKYLHECQDLSPISSEELVLFEEEFENWTKLLDEYNLFVKKGKRLSNIRGMIAVYRMGQLLDDIIEIQNKIIEL